MVKKMVKDDDGELEMLLGEIPLATSNNFLHLYNQNHVLGGDDHGYGHGMCGGNVMCYDDYDNTSTQIKYRCSSSSPVSGFSLQSDGSSTSLFSGGGSPTSPPFEDLKSTNMPCPNSYWLDHSKVPDSPVFDEQGLCNSLSKMYIGKQHENPNGISFPDFTQSGNNYNTVNVPHKNEDCNSFRRGFSDCVGLQSAFPRNPFDHGPHGAEMNPGLLGLNEDCTMANLFRSQQCPGWHDTMLSQLNAFEGSMDSPRNKRHLMNGSYSRESVAPELPASLRRNPMVDDSFYERKYGMNVNEEKWGIPRSPNYSFCTNLRPYMSVEDLLPRSLPPSNARAVPRTNGRFAQGSLDAIMREGSFIIQGEGLSYAVRRGSEGSRCQSVGRETGFAKHLQRPDQALGTYESPRSPMVDNPFPLLPKYNSLAEARWCIYLIAKDQHGCRFLQRIFEEGTPEDVNVIFNEIIDHVVELMMNPFGNYLMQKLLEVCNEEQRMQIILVVTEDPGQLVRISLNTHGTRVVQKLIETLKTRQQISLVVSALEPGFLPLIKDLNGNHVVQHCLERLSSEDNKFIFIAAAKYCVDIATHQHGCCVLQKCIDHSSGTRRDKLVAEISANALLLAQHQYGNYVIQFILDLRIPSATAAIINQFKGNYVQMSMQKFSSHVVEKCLAVFNDENLSRVVLELLSTPRFDQLIQDPHANYVVQSALKYSEGHVHNSLVEAIETHKAISRNSPYSKKIFSQKLLKK